jgi:CHASE3 domain sensor protein
VKDNPQRETDMAREAVSELQEGLDSSKRLVERTRVLLTGEPSLAEEALIAEPEAQAAAPSTSETVQNPSGE